MEENNKETMEPNKMEGQVVEEKPIAEEKVKLVEKIVKQETKSKKTEAIVNGWDSPVSTKHAVAICNLIRNKNIDYSIQALEDVQKFKRAVPMKGEIPHRKGNMMSGRYPIKACGVFVMLLKSLKSNAIANELELEKYVLYCKPNVASRPHRKAGRARFKRTHIELKLVLPTKKNKKSRKIKRNKGVKTNN